MRPFLITFFAVIAFILPGSLTATTYYVNPGEKIQDAIDASTDGDTIIVRAATYTGDGNRDLDFSNGLPDTETRAITLESESGADVTIIDCQGTELDPHRGFYFHSGETTASVVDGFTITNGSKYYGGGIFCIISSPTITNCTISSNTADDRGGGMYCLDYSSPTITNCTISGNEAYYGGGIYCDDSSPTITNCTISGNSANYFGGVYCKNTSPTITNCTITGNSANDYGGGIYCFYSSPTITNCTISGNWASEGGGIDCNNSSPTITDCTISGNSANDYGGGICCKFESDPAITNCTITGNSAYYGGGICCKYNSDPTITNCTITGNSIYSGYGSGGGIYCDSSNPTITNCTITGNSVYAGYGNGGGIYCYQFSSPTMTDCILWGNAAPRGHEIAVFLASTLTVRYGDVQGGAGEAYVAGGCTLDLDGTNIDADPLFVKGRYHEFYLSHTAAGQPADSPCVDAGSDTAANLGLDQLTTRIDSEYDIGTVDMGYHAPSTIWIHSITRSGSDITIEWKARSGLSYVVQWSTDHEFGTYTEVSVGTTYTWTDVGGALQLQRYYRVREQ